MLVRDRMTPNPVAITPGMSLKDALNLIRTSPFRHLPVVDEAGKLVGITTERDLIYSSPSPTLSLSIFEVDYVLSRMTVEQVMKREVVTVHPDLPIEEAARVMLDNKIDCLPVMEGEQMIGIVTETDIFRAFVEGLGGGHSSLRLTVTIPEQVGSLAQITSCIAAAGGNIYSLGMFWGERSQERLIALRLENVERDVIIQALQKEGIEVHSVWEPGE